MLRVLGAIFALFCVSLPANSQPQPPIEAYGELEEIRYAALSESGRKIAMAMNKFGKSFISIYVEGEGYMGTIGTENIAVRGLQFVGEDYVIIKASETTRIRGFRGQIDYSAALAINLKTLKIKQLLRGTKDLYPGQSGLGRIVGQSNDSRLFMPAFTGPIGPEPDMHLYSVDMDKGRGRLSHRGNKNTIDFIVDPDGTLQAREDYSNERDKYQIFTWRNGQKTLVYEEENADRIPFSLVGVKPDKSKLIITNRDSGNDNRIMRELSFAGNFSAPIMTRSDADIEWVIMDQNRVVQGVQYSGATPSYEFFDAALNADMASLIEATQGVSVQLVDWTSDWRYLLLRLEGEATSGMYVRYDRSTKQNIKIGDMRPAIPAEAIGSIYTIEYPARDGLTIPAIVTFPPGTDIESAKKLPLLAMPHGGPTTYDSVRFDWMAQYFANRGYLVLQPNFRGSTGYGTDFLLAGNGEWGGKMQDDVTDGVNALIKDGMADPDRVCIVGASYDGYSALAGGAFTPDLYQCVVAIAPVSDLPRMLRDEKRDFGKNHWVVAYWEDRIADGDAQKDKLKSISPVHHAEAFSAPVLLIHGRKDTVVPIDQSEVMRKALKRADKDVELIKLKGEDHWLSDGDTRLETLKAMSAFVDEHIGK